MRPVWVCPPVLIALSIALMVITHLYLSVVRIFPFPWNMAGLLPLALGFWLNAWADRLFKRHKTTIKPHLRPSALITTGPFRFTRNPIYLGSTTILFGTSVLLGTLSPLVVTVGFSLTIALVFVPIEENNLAEVFGDQWHAYRKRVRRWL